MHNVTDCPSYTVTPTPTVSGWDTTMLTLTSPDGSRVERYIVEFECRVRNITFVEKCMSVNASEGTGRVATNVSCFGGLGQLYRVKVWAVSGPNISQALVCVTGMQCREEGRRAVNTTTPTTPTNAVNTATLTTPTTAVNTATPSGSQPSSTGNIIVQFDGLCLCTVSDIYIVGQLMMCTYDSPQAHCRYILLQ